MFLKQSQDLFNNLMFSVLACCHLDIIDDELRALEDFYNRFNISESGNIPSEITINTLYKTCNFHFTTNTNK